MIGLAGRALLLVVPRVLAERAPLTLHPGRLMLRRGGSLGVARQFLLAEAPAVLTRESASVSPPARASLDPALLVVEIRIAGSPAMVVTARTGFRELRVRACLRVPDA